VDYAEEILHMTFYCALLITNIYLMTFFL